MNVFASFLITLVIIFVIPIIVYGVFSSLFGLKEPDKKLNFLIGVLVQKVGTSLGFVGLFFLAQDYFADNWLLYATIWFSMYALTEIGQVIMTEYSKKEALAGIISEAIYFPLSAWIISLLVN